MVILPAGFPTEPLSSPSRPRAAAPFALLLLALLLVSRPSAAQEFSDVFFFGDSLTDTGIFCTGLVFSEQGYASGRCSNGDLWADVLAEALGVNLDSLEENFAKGSDTTSDLDDQIDVFELSIFFGDADPDALYVIWLGSNDVLNMPSSPTAMEDAVARVIDGIDELAGMGAEHFLVLNLPDVGRAWGHFNFEFPEVEGEIFTPLERDAVTSLSSEFNVLLDQALATLTGVTIQRLDVHAIVEEVFANPAAFGFSAATIDTTTDDTAFAIPCLEDAACENDPQGAIADQFILFDALHPTTAAHALIGARAVQLVPEPGSIAAQALGLLVAAALAFRSR